MIQRASPAVRNGTKIHPTKEKTVRPDVARNKHLRH